MHEAIFKSLADQLHLSPVVLVSVIETYGSTPRLRGSKMLITANEIFFSIGGGLAEASVIGRARDMLQQQISQAELQIDLRGGEKTHGVCGGLMQISLQLWQGESMQIRAQAIADRLASGFAAQLSADELGLCAKPETLMPNVRLLIIGGGHCGAALLQFAQSLDFDLHAFDTRLQCEIDSPNLASANVTRWVGNESVLRFALQTERLIFVVLLNRDFHADLAALKIICENPPSFIGMMGSRKRIKEVFEAMPEQAETMQQIRAPIGLEIDAQTPAEIAISILAELIAWRAHEHR